MANQLTDREAAQAIVDAYNAWESGPYRLQYDRDAMASICTHGEQVARALLKAKREIELLRFYGNNGYTSQADEAMIAEGIEPSF